MMLTDIMPTMSMMDEVDIEIQKRAWREARETGQMTPELAAMPMLEVYAVCACAAGLAPHEGGILACPVCHTTGIAKELD